MCCVPFACCVCLSTDTVCCSSADTVCWSMTFSCLPCLGFVLFLSLCIRVFHPHWELFSFNYWNDFFFLILLLLCTSIMGYNLDHLLLSKQLLEALLIFFLSLLSLFLFFSHWVMSLDLSSSSLNVSFVFSIWLLNLFSEMLFSGIVIWCLDGEVERAVRNMSLKIKINDSSGDGNLSIWAVIW